MTSTRSTSALRASLAFALVLAPLAAVAAGTPDQQCRATKLKAAGKYASALAKCQAKAASDGSAVDAECLSKASAKLSDAFTKADTKGDSTCAGLESSSAEDVEATIAAVLAAAPAATGGGKCPSAIYKAAGKLASTELSAWSKFVTTGDTAKRDESINKGVTKLGASIVKAEESEGCTGTGQTAAVQTAVQDGNERLVDCLSGYGSCTEAVVEAGGTVTTDSDGDGADAQDPIVASVETPVAGTVSVEVVEVGSTPPAGYEILGQEVDITAPAATAMSPLVLTFVLDASLLPGDPLTVALARNGVVVADCTGAAGVADPDPCIESRTVLASGDLEIVALTSQASIWSPMVQTGPTTTVTTTTSTTIPPPPADHWMRWQVRADKVGSDVATEIDIGWTGSTHDFDPVDGSAMRFGLSCPSASLPTSYGDCTVTGFDPTEGNCRCANNTATVCDEPLTADADDCGGNFCNCYTRPPFGASAAGTPVCMYAYALSNASGDWNPDTGTGDVTLDESIRLHLGIQLEQPCPACVGDPVANDGTKGGTCSGGQTPGAMCDAHGTDPTYPAPGGGATSLDCLPSNATNIAGTGLKFLHSESTSSVSLPAVRACSGAPGENCPCAVCSGDHSYGCSTNSDCLERLGKRCSVDQLESCTTNADCSNVNEGNCHSTFLFCTGAPSVSCTNNADCVAVNVGPCVSPTCGSGGGTDAASFPNNCPSGTCPAGTDGESVCADPTGYSYCDGIVEEDGKGVITCTTNTDCDSASPIAGDCTITAYSDCFTPTITATGAADSDSPRTVAVLCSGASANAGANQVSGLPGPVRLRTDWTVTYGE